MLKIIFIVIITLCVTGCGHNISVQGFGVACPYGAMGYGTFSCVRDNVTVKSAEKTTADGIETVNEFTVGRQTTGYDVDLEKIKKSSTL